MRKGSKHSEESKRLIRQNVSQALLGHKVHKATKEKISQTLKGYKHSFETKKKMSLVKLIKTNWEDLNYLDRHRRINKAFGKAYKCVNKRCKNISKTYEWSNISGEYKEMKEDWQMLCRSCHKLFDDNRKIPWKK